MGHILRSSQWNNLVRFGVCGVSVAAVSFLLWRWRNRSQEPQPSWYHSFTNFFMKTKEATKNSFAVSINNIEKGIEDWIEMLKDKYLSEETQEVLEDIMILIDHVKKYDMDGKPYNSSVFILLAVLKKVQDLSRFLNWESSLPVTTDIPDKLLSSSKYFSSFAFNIYNAALLDESDTKGIAEIFSIKSEDLMYAELQDDDGEGICPKFVFCVDHGSQSLVLTVRGTKSIKDALIDMVCDDSPFLSGFAHSGILSGTRKVWSLVGQTVISACQQHPQYKLVLTGHSLGAGVAVLLTMDLLMGDISSRIPSSTDILCFAFAPPPVYRPDVGMLFTGGLLPDGMREKITIVINNHDGIPRTSLGTLTRLLTSLRAVDEINLSLQQQIQLIRHRAVATKHDDDDDVTDDDEDREEEEEVTSLMKKVMTAVAEAIQDTFPFLQHPGRVIYLKKKKRSLAGGDGVNDSYVAINEDSLVSPHNLYLLRNMVNDHKRVSYERALELVK